MCSQQQKNPTSEDQSVLVVLNNMRVLGLDRKGGGEGVRREGGGRGKKRAVGFNLRLY